MEKGQRGVGVGEWGMISIHMLSTSRQFELCLLAHLIQSSVQDMPDWQRRCYSTQCMQ